MLVIAIPCDGNRKTKNQNNINMGFHRVPSFDMKILKSHLLENIVRIFHCTSLLEGPVKFFFVQRDLICSLLDKVFHSVFDIEWFVSISWIVGDDRENVFIYEMFLQLNDVQTRVTKEYPRFFTNMPSWITAVHSSLGACFRCTNCAAIGSWVCTSTTSSRP